MKVVQKSASKPKVPSLRHHKASGRAYVVLNNRTIYVGDYGTDDAVQNYNKTIAEWLAAGKQVHSSDNEASIDELLAQFWVWAENYYRTPDGKATSELDSVKYSLRPLRQLYGGTPGIEFGPRCLRTVQQQMVTLGWCRNNVNRSLSRVKMFFKWAVSQEFLPGSVYHALSTVAGLRRGRCDARETEPVKPVPQEYIDIIRPYVSRQIWAIIQLQLLTAARPSEILNMRPCDIDRSGKIWVYSPTDHKTAHHGHDRKIYIGPKGQEVLTPFLLRPADAYCFSPAEAFAERLIALNQKRNTRESCGNEAGASAKNNPRWEPGVVYNVAAYRNAVKRAIERAIPAPDHLKPHDGETKDAWQERLTKKQKTELKTWYKQFTWHPHQLRHNSATYLRKEFGIEVARIILGHHSAGMTEVYAEQDQHKAIEAILKVG